MRWERPKQSEYRLLLGQRLSTKYPSLLDKMYEMPIIFYTLHKSEVQILNNIIILEVVHNYTVLLKDFNLTYCFQNGDKAAGFAVAEQYVSAFGKLAQTSTTLMLPSNTGDVSSMVAQAMAIYSKVGGPPADTPPTIPVTPAIPVKVVAAPAPAAPAKK